MLAEHAYKSLRGLFCVYKPPGVGMGGVIFSLKHNLSKGLNALPCRPPRQILKFNDEVDKHDSLPVVTTVPDIADHTLVVGPRYMEDDFNVECGSALGAYASGVSLMSIGTPGWLRQVVLARLVRVYRVKAELGRATDNFDDQGRTLERTTYGHVTPGKMDRVISAMQAGHQKHMFTSSGINLQTQEAYELAVSGLLRPKTRDAGPVIYGFRCVDFDPPDFTLEIQTINETVVHLQSMVHRLGVMLRSGATVKQVHRIRYGPLTLDHALLRKHWTAENIIDNLAQCKELLSREQIEHKPLIGNSNENVIPQLPER